MVGALVVVESVEGFSRIPQNGKFATTLLTSGGALREQGSSAVFGLWMCWPDHATFGYIWKRRGKQERLQMDGLQPPPLARKARA